MSRLPENVIVNTTLEPSENCVHAEHTFGPAQEEIDGEAPRRSKRQRIAKSFYFWWWFHHLSRGWHSYNHLEVFASPNADSWKEVVHSEMDSILSNGTWELVDRPYVCKPVGCKWVFKRKFRPDGTIDKYKARLVFKCYTQKEGKIFFNNY
jgi:hypothetical protein